MKNLPADAETIGEHLKGIAGFDPKLVKRFFEEGPAKAGIHFFLIQYEPGEVIMAKGTTSDYAALHVQGVVRIRDVVPDYRTKGRGCWEHPLSRRLENLVRTHEKALAGEGASVGRGFLGAAAGPLYRRFPSLPLGAIEWSERWLPARVAGRLRSHVAKSLAGRLAEVRRVERELSNPSATAGADQPDATAPRDVVVKLRKNDGQLRPVEDRFMGIAGTLWNLPRTVTLIAGNDAADENKPCVMLLIKRKALTELIKKSPVFYKRQMEEFLDNALPRVLARNRLFQDRLFIEDVCDWRGLLAGLQGKARSPFEEGLGRIRERLDRRLRRWLETASPEHLDGAEQGQIIEQLNQALTTRDLPLSDVWARAALGAEANVLLEQPTSTRNDCEVFRLNRLLLEAALPGIFQGSPRPFPLTHEEFRTFSARFADLHRTQKGDVLQPSRLEMIKDKKAGKKSLILFNQGDPADAIFLILNGMVRIVVDLPGGRSTVSNVGADQYLGESAVLDETSAGDPPPIRTAHVETLCDTTVLKLDRAILKELFAGDYRALGDKLKRERRLLDQRGTQMRAGNLLPPSDPPVEIAERLVLTRNLLLIDMHKCTRCDQCVRGCAEAHDLQPRFHRSNPELRFGKWEVAGACLNCIDSPCQQVCPVGAITLLEDLAVQIHRDRCIGCKQCANECPFGVIDMVEPTSPQDAPSSLKGVVASKCDLCLTEQADPPCVACCPYDAAQRVDPVSFFSELRDWANVQK